MEYSILTNTSVSNHDTTCQGAQGQSPCYKTIVSVLAKSNRVDVDKMSSETKIDRIENRLASIERLLRQSSGTWSSATTESLHDSPREISNFRGRIADLDRVNHDQTTQVSAAGDVGVQAESIAATQTLEQTVDRDPILQQDPQLKTALNSLRRIVDCAQSDVDETLTVKPLSTDASQARPPSWELVKPILERVEGLFQWAIYIRIR